MCAEVYVVSPLYLPAQRFVAQQALAMRNVSAKNSLLSVVAKASISPLTLTALGVLVNFQLVGQVALVVYVVHQRDTPANGSLMLQTGHGVPA